MRLQLLHPVRGLPGVVVPAQRRDLRPVGVPQAHQVVVELGHVRAGLSPPIGRQSGTPPYSSAAGKPLPVR